MFLSEWLEFPSAPCPVNNNNNNNNNNVIKSLTRPGREQASVSVRMA